MGKTRGGLEGFEEGVRTENRREVGNSAAGLENPRVANLIAHTPKTKNTYPPTTTCDTAGPIRFRCR